jgi:Zn-dependent protease
LIGGIIASLLFFASVIAHELSHSIVAIRNGIPVKSVTLFIFGGVARITREATRPVTELVMAGAGPLSSLVIGGIFGAFWLLLRGGEQLMAAGLVLWLAQVNLLVAAFNLIPGFPLDGGRVLRAFLWRRSGNYVSATRTASMVGRGVAYSFILGGIVMIFVVNPFNGLWLAFIGWFLENAANASYRQVKFREGLRGLSARDVMSSSCPSVPPHLSLREFVQSYVLPGGGNYFLVSEGGKLMGIITFRNIKQVPQHLWDTTTVRESMVPSERVMVAQIDEDATSIIERMNEQGISQMPVVSEGRVVGVVTRDHLLHLIGARSKLKM